MGATGLSADPKEYRSRLDEQSDEQIDAWAAELMRDVSIRRGVRKVVRDFARHEIAPHAEEWDREHTFPVDTVRAMGDLGLFGLPFPEEYEEDVPLLPISVMVIVTNWPL